MSLQYAKEVFAFKNAILWEVGAMNCILDTVHAELGTHSVGAEMLGNLWIRWSNELPKTLHSILLSNFNGDYGSI